MKLSAALRATVSIFPVVLLGASTLRAQESGELILSGVNHFPASNSANMGAVLAVGGTLSTIGAAPLPSTSNAFVFTGSRSTFSAGSTLEDNRVFTATGAGSPLVIGSHPMAGLLGSITGLSIKPNQDGRFYHVKATVALSNPSSKAFHHVTATVYLSPDGKLSDDDLKLATLNLSDYVAKGKLGKSKTLSLPFKHKIPAAIASYLDGKYLVVVLGADDLDAPTVLPVVIGPITLP